MTLKNARKELSNQLRLFCVTSTALLCHWGQKSLEDMTSFATDFETYAIWQGYVEDPAAKVCSKEGPHYRFEQSARNPTINLIHKFGNPLGIPYLSCTT